MTDKEIDNLINRTNKRAVTIAETFGKKSPIYGRYIAVLQSLVGSENIRFKNGIVQASRGKKAIEHARYSERAKYKAEYLPTKGEIIKNTIKSAKERGEKLTQKQAIATYKARNNLMRYISNNIDKFYSLHGLNIRNLNDYTTEELKEIYSDIKNEIENDIYRPPTGNAMTII